MRNRLKLLYDGNLFCLKGRTGLYRVASDLLCAFARDPLFDVTLIRPVAEELRDVPVQNVPVLKMPLLKSMMETGPFAPKETKALQKERTRYRRLMASYDAYFSPFFPVPAVAKEAGLITGLFVHDMIPVYEPEYATDSTFSQRYTAWMQHNASDFVAVNSKWTESQYLKFRPDDDPTKIVLSYLGADQRFQPQPEEKIKAVRDKYHIPNRTYFLSVCEITERKNLPHVLKAFVRFLEETGADDVCLVLTGPKRSEHEKVFKTIASLPKYAHKIIQTGFVDDADMPALYSGATGFVYVSLSEGFGLPILEAMQCGTPVISADNTSLPEVGGSAVLYVSGRDVRQTAAAFFEIYSRPALRADLARLGRQQATRFSCARTSGTVMGKFLSLAADK